MFAMPFTHRESGKSGKKDADDSDVFASLSKKLMEALESETPLR